MAASLCLQKLNILHTTYSTFKPFGLSQPFHNMSTEITFTSPDPDDTVKVLVGPPGSSQSFILPKLQLLFYSPYLRTLSGKVGASQPIILPDDDPAAVGVLIAWMNYESPPAKCHQQGAEFEKMVRVKDKKGVPLACKVWVLAHRLGGPCLVLCDQCMRYLYEDYTRPVCMLGTESLKITLAITLYAM